MKQTPLYALHLELGAKMVPFAGYQMPVQFPMGVMGEHVHTRTKAGLFDVSHMGQLLLSGASWEAVAGAFETLVPQDVLGLSDGRQRYGFFTNAAGGIEDDLMFARQGDDLLVVVNAACKEADIARMERLEGVTCKELGARALLALQGPIAGAVLSRFDPSVSATQFMDVFGVEISGVTCWASRSGYTGEDGFEISVPADQADAVARALLGEDEVAAIGLGARDSLRLEAGLCLYGNDIDAATTPASAGLGWAIQKVRRTGGARAGNFPGADAILGALQDGPEDLRVGLQPEGRAPMRAGVILFETEDTADPIGRVTSGGFGPSVGGPVAMGYVPAPCAEPGRVLWGEVRGKRLPVKVAPLPFVTANFKR